MALSRKTKKCRKVGTVRKEAKRNMVTHCKNLTPTSKSRKVQAERIRARRRRENLTPTSRTREAEAAKIRARERRDNLTPTTRKKEKQDENIRARERRKNITPTSRGRIREARRMLAGKRRDNLTPKTGRNFSEAERTRASNYYEKLTPTSKKRKIEKVAKARCKKRHEYGRESQVALRAAVNADGYYLPQQKFREFYEKIEHYAEFVCTICRKMCFRHQVSRVKTETVCAAVQANISSTEFFCCNRCKGIMKKSKVPSTAFWNNMMVAEIPKQLKLLSEIEIRLLSRVRPFMKIIRLPGRFGQLGCKGQAILFPQQVEEVADQLPLTADKLGLAIVLETLELRNNMSRCSEFSVNLEHLQCALSWLMQNNLLYKSVRVEMNKSIENICSQICITEPAVMHCADKSAGMQTDTFTCLVGDRQILHGTFHQASVIIPDPSIRGRQCTAIAATAIVMGQVVRPFMNWRPRDVDRALLVGSTYYKECLVQLQCTVPTSGYLMAAELLASITIGDDEYTMNIEADYIAGVTTGGTIDIPGIHCTLQSGIAAFFVTRSYGLLTINGTSVAICKQSEKWWLFDSHSRGAKGRVAANGKAMLMNFASAESLSNHILILTNSKKDARDFSIAAIQVVQHSHSNDGVDSAVPASLNSGAYCSRDSDENILIGVGEDNDDNMQLANEIETTALMPIDIQAPVLEDVVLDGEFSDEGVPIHNLRRKTDAPLSALKEKRAEELAWYFLYPDGRNGFGEDRKVPITPLDYFQTRVMSADLRFQQAKGYLFYALSNCELWKVSKMTSVCGRLLQKGVQVKNVVSKLHITMRNIRGTSAYWHDALQHLLSMTSTLGPPTWFLTLSCNDLNWSDMLRALLIVDGRPDEPIDSLTFEERKRLIDLYPVVVSRQFMYRFNTLLNFLKNDPNILGGPIVDFWWRMEVQLRGSPHIHMAIWCENVPPFDSEDGRKLIGTILSCSTETSDSDLNEIVKKVQIHRHTQTCFKKRDATNCRFGFPRKESNDVRILDADQALRNGGRFCILKRNSDETMVNNYNPFIVRAWNANMDLQPCGTADGVAFYIAKYIAKSEPATIQESIRKAMQTVSESDSDGDKHARKIFAGSMAILNHRQVSACECAFRLCHLKLRDSSRRLFFVNNCFPEERYRMLRIGSDDTFNNIFDKYVNRPLHLEGICLGEFAANYESTSRGVEDINADDDHDNDDEDDDDDNYDKDNERVIVPDVDRGNDHNNTNNNNRDNAQEKRPRQLKCINLLNNLGRMRVRTRPAVLRKRHYTPDSDPEHYYYGLLVMHLPFRNEATLLEGSRSSKDAFLAKKDELRSISMQMNLPDCLNFEGELRNAIQRIVAEQAVENMNAVGTNRDDDVPPLADVLNDDDDLVMIDSNVCEDDLNELAGKQGMSDEYFQGCMQSLNVAQKKLIKKISDHALNPLEQAEQLLMFITGGAGSGKSYTLKLIIELIRRLTPSTTEQCGKNAVMVAAPTGVAAKLVGGTTLHNAFVLPIEKAGEIARFSNLSGTYLETMRLKWKFIKWVVIDEISMVSYRALRMIHLRLQQLKQCEKPFGGMHMLVFGDLMQLPPVRATHCFHKPNEFQGEPHLWRMFSFSELTTIMRQQNDTEFVDLLNNLRVGSLTVDQLAILSNRELELVNQQGEFDDQEAIRIFPTTKQVAQYNEKMCEELVKQNVRLYNIRSEDRSLENATSGLLITDPKKLPSDPNKTGGFERSIKLGVGCRVMLRRNINISSGLVNGSMGVVRRIEWSALRLDQMEDGDLPKHVTIKFDDLQGETLVEPCTVVFQGLRGSGKVERRMLPIILCWAVTVHKLQGVTLEKAVIDLGRKLFCKGQAYVALSRVKGLQGVAISELCPARLLDKPHDDRALDELKRLRELPPQ